MEDPASSEEYTLTLHVALLTDVRIPAHDYGGTERVVEWLAKGLAELGHRVTLLAPAGSHSQHAGSVAIKLPPQNARHFDPRPYLPAGVDMVHAHFPIHPVGDLPLRWTLHGNAKAGEVLPPGGIALSANHAQRHGMASWVYNGLDPAEYTFAAIKKDFDLFLGRLHAVKGWQVAVEGARQSGRKLTVAGGWRPTLRQDLRFAGKVSGAAKAALLAQAACLWVPVQWDEPFGLTTIEAMVSGTPVLGTPRGALPEIVRAGTGLLGATLEELVALRPALDQLDPEVARANVLERFTYREMAAAYVEIYEDG